MPFIRGRYHLNAIAGETLEAAREAEAVLLALEHEAAQARGQSDNEGDDGEGESASDSGKGPIHRVEIEAAELVPSHTGRAPRGFVAHVHREAMQPEQAGPGFVQSAASGNSIDSGDAQRARFASLRSPRLGRCRRLGMRHVRRRMCLPIIAIWLAFCVMSSRNPAGVIAANEFTAPPRSNSCGCGEYDAEIRAGRRAGLE